MTNKAILSIDIDSSGLDAFAVKLDAVNKAAADTGVWKQIDAIIKSITETVETLAQITANITPPKPPEEPPASVGSVFADMLGYSKRFASNVKSTTLDLMKWTGLSSIFGTVLSAGGLFGITRLAMGVSERRANAAGYGIDYGAHQSFGVQFGRLGNIDRILSGYQDAMTDVTKRGPLQYLLGHNANKQLESEDPSSAFIASLPGLMKMLGRTPHALWGDALKGAGLEGLGIDVNTAQILWQMNQTGELQDLIKAHKNRVASGDMGMSKKMQEAYVTFNDQIERAHTVIETKLKKGLSHLAPIAGEIAKTFATTIKIFLSHPKTKEWLGKLEAGLKWIGEQISAGNVDKLVSKIEADVSSFKNFLGLFGIGTPNGSSMGLGEYLKKYPNAEIPNRWRGRPNVGHAASRGSHTDLAAFVANDAQASEAVKIALEHLGEHEHANKARLVEFLKTGGHGMDPETLAWCAAFVGAALRKAGIQDIPAAHGGNIATSYARWGEQVTGAVKSGDVVVESRGRAPGQTGGHVGLATGRVDKKGRIEVIAGNTGHRVSAYWVSRERAMVRRATRKANPQLKSQGQREVTVEHQDSGVNVEHKTTPFGAMMGPIIPWGAR